MSIKDRILNAIYYSIPYGLTKKRLDNKKHQQEENSFYKRYIEFSNSNKSKEFKSYGDCPVISIEGLGFSGSGAVVDLLREYSNTLCMGAINEESPNANQIVSLNYEIDFLRLSGGLFEIERFIGTNNVFHTQALLDRFVKMVESCPLYLEVQEAKDTFFRFFYAITCKAHCDMRYPCYNPYLYGSENASCFRIFYLKKMSLLEYRKIAHDFLAELLHLLCMNGKIPVLDQFCNDLENDINKYLEYVPNLKIIHVYRDPRDVYEYAIQNNVEWIVHNGVDDFIDWYKIISAKFDKKDDDFQLYIRFEELVNNYETENRRIEKFLNFNAEDHINMGKYLKPEVSRGNVAIWKNDLQRKAEFDVIFSELRDYCYA